MSQAYQYTAGGVRTEICAFADDAWVLIDSTNGSFHSIHLPAAERVKAAEALAGDEFAIMAKLREVDPADVEVGMVVEVEANDGTWSVKGEVESIQVGFGWQFYLRVAGRARTISVHDATVRVVSRPEPDPADQEREALREAYDAAVAYVTGDHGGPDSGGSIRDALIPELHARGVRVVEDGEQ